METKDWVNILISLISGFIGGGVSSLIVINKSKVKQKTVGDNSPNIVGNVNHSKF